MSSNYIKRTLKTVLKKAAAEFPAVILTGLRQSGETTLLLHLFGKRYRYVSLESKDVRVSAEKISSAFLEMQPTPVIFDDVQYAPDLIPYIKDIIDTARSRSGQYLLKSL